MKLVRVALLLFYALSTPILATNSTISEKKLQQMQDLCSLNIYMNGQFNKAADWGSLVVRTFIPSKGGEYSFIKDKMSGRAQSFASILLGDVYDKAIGVLLSGLVHSTSSGICNAERGWEIQQTIDRATRETILPEVEAEIGQIDPSNAEDDSIRAIRAYFDKSIPFQQDFYYEMSLKGPEKINTMLKEGFGGRSGDKEPLDVANVDFDKGLCNLASLSASNQHNPFFWEGYYIGTYPNTLNPFKLYMDPHPLVEDLFRESVKHIQKGDFKAWWKKHHETR
jgi:hypothetical protein